MEVIPQGHQCNLDDDLASDNISWTIIFYANQTLRMITLCYRDFNTWSPYGMDSSMNDEVHQPYTLKILHTADLAIVQISYYNLTYT